MFIVTRSKHNPILEPTETRPWESVASFNPSPVLIGKDLHVFYRALARPDVLITPYAGRSTIGYTCGQERDSFEKRVQVIAPTEAWEHYGCEDPRATYFEGKWYVFYTALGGYPFSASNIRVAVAIGDTPESLNEKHLVTPFNAKAAALFPERVNGKIALLLSAHTDEPPTTVAIAYADTMEDYFTPAFWDAWQQDLESHRVSIAVRSSEDHIEVGSVPLKIEGGWLLMYSYIQNYFGGGERVFGIETVLLKEDNPQEVIGATIHPLLTPEANYERYGIVPDIVFPTGLVRRGDTLDIYYGAADTTSAIAHVSLPHLLSALTSEGRDTFMTREPGGPFLSPILEHAWESRSVSNAAAVDLEGSVHLLYRAQGEDNTSVIGYARLEDGRTLSERLPEPVYAPRIPEEQKMGSPTGNSGCEDPRAVVIDGAVHMCYTAYDGVHATRGALSSISVEDFVAHAFENWSTPTLLTPEGINDKDVALFPEKIDDKLCIVHRIDPNICIDMSEHVPPHHEVNKCIELMGRRAGMWDATKVGVAGAPHKVPEGWLFIYHAVGADHVYRLGAALLSDDASSLLARTNGPILAPVMEWEKVGVVNNVVFSCGSVIRDGLMYVYYGGADTSLGLATISLNSLMERLTPNI